MIITFDRPWFFLILPVVLGLLIISLKFIYSRNLGLKIFQILLRFILATALVLALTQPTVKFTGKDVTTIFLLDVSDSVRERKEEVVEFVNDAVKGKKKKDKVGIIAFGSDTRVEQFITNKVSFDSFQTDVSTQATDLEEAVNMALAQMPEDSAKRIVLITDGNENEGSLRDTAAQVIESGCVFEVKKLEENVSDEVYVSDMTIPEEVGIGENFNIRVEVESNVACKATVSLYSGRTLKGQQEVNLQKGTNQFVFKDTQTDEGLKTYRVTVDAEKDTVSVNNEFSAFTNIETELPILIVEGKQNEADNFVKIMDSIGVKYDRVMPSTVPHNISEFTEYSAIVFVDVFADDLRDGFMDNLENYVKNYGGGFIVTGGPNSYALGNYRDTPIETVLPVEMELKGENEIPVMAMQMIIDQSGSMYDGNGIITNLDLAKESAVAALQNLRDDDYVGVLSFDDSYTKVVPIQYASNKDEIQEKIYSISIGGGTSIYPALLAGATDVSQCDAMIKHIILLTDGQDYFDDYVELEDKINAAGITLTCVSIGTQCNDLLLEDLADKCGGRYFHTDINTDIPRIFAQEVFLSSNTYLINQEFTPVIRSNDMLIREYSGGGFPNLYGYVATTEKDRSIQVLESPFGDPLLCYWQYGLGKTVAWTSDVTGEWSSQYANWENTQLMWHNILQYVTEDMAMEGADVQVRQNGSKATLEYTTREYDGNTTVTATIFDDEGNVTEIELDPKKPGSYETQIDMNSTGIYTVNIQQKQGNDVVGSTNTAAIMQYSMEYRFYPDNTLLEEYVQTINGNFIEEASDVFSIMPTFVKNRFNLANALLIFAAVFFLIDIAVRRFHIDLSRLAPVVAIRKKAEQNKEQAQARKLAKALEKDNKSKGAGAILTDEISTTGAAASSANTVGGIPVENAGKTVKAEKLQKPKKEKVKDSAPQVTNLYAQLNATKTYTTSQGASPQSPVRPMQGSTPQSTARPMQESAPQPTARPMQGSAPQPASRPVQRSTPQPTARPIQGSAPQPAARPTQGTGGPIRRSPNPTVQSLNAKLEAGRTMPNGNAAPNKPAAEAPKTRVWTRNSE